jgi:tripartite-type tricarboxylate transporter receptor subunit TctC
LQLNRYFFGRCIKHVKCIRALTPEREAKMKRLPFAVAFVVAAAFAWGGAVSAQAQTFPSRPVTIVVGFPPGGPTDTVARVIGERMKGSLGESVVVENVSGASGTIAAAKVARAEPDGHTLSVGQWTSNVGAAAIYPLQFDMLKDFEPVSLLTTSYLWILGKTALPAKDLKELVAWLKANPGKATVATVGVGSAAHLCVVDFQNKTGTNIQVVPYRGGAPALQDVAGGQVDLACLETSQTLALYRADKIKVFGVAAPKRWYAAPNVPTLDEAGVPGVHIAFWHGLWAPKGTPKPIIAKLNAAVVAAFADPAVQKRFTDIGHAMPARNEQTPEALFAHHKAELDKWRPIIKAAGIKPPG